MYRLALLIFVFLGVAAIPASAEPRLALVIGNAKYGAEIGKLTNPANDADLMAKTLTKLGFKVTKLVDADQKQMKRAIADFGTALTKAGPDAAGLFYYAGHGVQIDGENFLVPLGAAIEKEADAELEAVPASAVLKQMEFAGNRINIVIMDACRNNPLARGMRSATRGLARMDAPRGSFIAYLTAPGETAADGNSKNSPYTLALTKAIQAPGIAIEEAFSNARIEVLQATQEKQIPWESSSLTGRFYFNPAPAGAAAAVQPAAPAPTTVPRSPVDTAPGKTFTDCPTCPEMVSIPAGAFTMGAQDGEAGSADAERPQVEVTVPAFAIGRTEVRRRDFEAFVTASGYRPNDNCWGEISNGNDFIKGNNWAQPGFDQSDDDPVVCITAADAEAYVKWLSKTTGATYRLPSEAEWEYAARAGSTSTYTWGDAAGVYCEHGNIADETAKRYPNYSNWSVVACDDGFIYTAPVASFAPNAFGLFDMLGNVKEWTADCWNDSLAGHDATAKARRSGNCKMRVVRSSAWNGPPEIGRLAYREGNNVPTAYFNYGFRIARDL